MNINNLNKSKEGLYLPLMEAFHTIQGEGFFSGKSAFFLRIGGCDVGCQWCDVKESWDPSKHKLTSVQSIVDQIKKYNTDTVVITGGEPLMWDLSYLTKSLKFLSYQIHLETSGAYPLSGDFDWICLSPKKNKPALKEIKPISNELKVIINSQRDLLWAEKQRYLLSSDCKLYLQPEWSKRDKILPFITDYVMKNSDWKISLQAHKYMNMP